MDYRAAKKELTTMITLNQEAREVIETQLNAIIATYRIDVTYELVVDFNDRSFTCDYDAASGHARANLAMCATHALKLGVDPIKYVVWSMAHEFGHHLTAGIKAFQYDLSFMLDALRQKEEAPEYALDVLKITFPTVYSFEVTAWEISEKLHSDAQCPQYQKLRKVCLGSYNTMYDTYTGELEKIVVAQTLRPSKGRFKDLFKRIMG
jgi:hypothetical protein